MDLKVWPPLSGVDQSILNKVRLAYVFGHCGSEALLVTNDDEVLFCALTASSCFPAENCDPQNLASGRVCKIEALTKQGVEGLSFGCNKMNQLVMMNNNHSTFLLLRTSTGKVIQVGEPCWMGCESCGDKAIISFSDVWGLPKISEVACGSQHCLALSTTGEVFGWGNNEWGQISDVETLSDYLEEPFKFEGTFSERVVKISCGYDFSVAILENGLVCCWGKDFKENDTCITCPGLVPFNGIEIKEIVCGSAHVLALTNTCELYVWGSNNRGQLGLGDKKLRSVPVKNETIGKVVDIAATYLSSISAVKTTDSAVFMWGDCAGSIVLHPMKTSYKSIMDVFAYYCSPRVTYKPIDARHCQSLPGSVSDTIKRAFEDKETSDLIIKAEDREIFVHRAILRLRSDYFRTLLKDPWTKEDQKTVEIKQNYNVIYSYIRYLYTGELKADLEFTLELVVFADEYQDLSFKELCENIIQNGIAIDNVGILYPLALKLNLTRVQESCLAFASLHTSDVVKTPAFSTWDREVLMEFILQCERRKMFKF